MKPISYARYRFPPDVIRHAVWLYLRFTLSYRDVEDLLAERGLIVSNEAIRRWVLKFGPAIAKNLRKSRPQSYTRWHWSAQRFLSTHAAAYNTFNVQRHLISARTHRAFRAAVMNVWRGEQSVYEHDVAGFPRSRVCGHAASGDKRGCCAGKQSSRKSASVHHHDTLPSS
jgi:hypothetical protein